MPRPPVKMFDLEDSLVDVSSSPYNISASVGGALLNSSGGAITLNLPALSSVRDGKAYYLKIVSGGNTVTVDGNSSELVEGAATFVMDTSSGNTSAMTLVARKTGGNAGWWIMAQVVAP